MLSVRSLVWFWDYNITFALFECILLVIYQLAKLSGSLEVVMNVNGFI